MTMMMARASRRPASRLSPRLAASARRLGRRRLAPFQPASRLSPRLAAFSAALLIPLTLAGAAPAERGSGRASPSEPQARPEARARRNLVPGGDFEKGDARGPAGWQRPDGLTSFWEKAEGRRGRCIRIDTDVLNSQFLEREKQMLAALEAGEEPPPPPRRIPVADEQQYATVAGMDGVHFASEKIPIDPARRYKLQVDAKVAGKASPKVWVKAYAKVRSRGGERERIVWKKALDCVDADREWSTFTTVFPTGTKMPERVEHIRVQLYAYWPRATYWFDDVRLFEIDEEEAEAFDVDRDRRRPAEGSAAPRSDGKEIRAS